VIEHPIADDLDVSGCEPRKTLRLLRRGNPLLIEGLKSQVVYRHDPVFAAEFSEAALKIAASDNALPASQPFQLFVRETESGTKHTVSHFITTTGKNNSVPQGYSEPVIDSTDQHWLTVIAAPEKHAPPKPATPPATPNR